MFPYHRSPEAMSLPAWQIADTVNTKLSETHALVITAPPGAGKSTLLPLTLLEDLEKRGKKGRILMLEPRRIAARQIAERMASLMQEEVGKTVGYRVRFETKVSRETRIEVLTEGILTRMLVDDPTLDGVDMVIFDEFHERSLHADLALALTRETQQLLRDDLKIVIMSATIDASMICQHLNAPLVESEGRMFPVDINYVETEVVATIRMAIEKHEGDILVFLPGEKEINDCYTRLAAGGNDGPTATKVTVHPLYSRISLEEQRKAIAPSEPGHRKVVLATSIAETSLTIEGVRVVIDSGLCRKMCFDAQSGLSHLQTVQISMDMANQRAGRAGRVAAGTCYRLWSLATQHRMQEHRTPEILEADLAPLALSVAGFGENHPERLLWLTPPPAARLAQGITLLKLLGALNEDQSITPHGKKLFRLPYHPRIAQMYAMAEGEEEQKMAKKLALQIEEERFGGNIIDYTAGKLLAYAYPERIGRAMQEGSGRYRLACGDEAFVERTEELASFDWIVAAQLNARMNGAGGSGRIFMAAPLEVECVTALMQQRNNLAWDSKQGRVVAQQERRIGQLLVDSKPLPLNQELRSEMQQVICLAAKKEGTSMLNFDERVENLQQRVAAVSEWHQELELPDLSTEAVLQKAEEWLPFWLDKATTVSEMKKIDLCQALWGLLSYEQQQEVERIAPTHIVVPTGSRIRVEYRNGAEAPVLRVRLQECFGLTDTPRVDDGNRPVLMELLSPGYKPVQLTADLANFWRETYFEVRKELRRRYPKHAWPDNPLEAEAVRGVKKKV
ncbi:MAG: ATP-dependent helicase HrpB [Bacteroidales bacterium]|nr:ATP-dependent helicase HrpB [Bacteroidales bacterium]